MNKLVKHNRTLTLLFFVLIICVSGITLTACQQESANPSSEKIKQLEDEVMNLKLESEKTTAALSEQKKDLEIIKEHLIPSYKAQITEETPSEPSTPATGDNSKASTPASPQPKNAAPATPAAPIAQPQKQPAAASKVNVPPAGAPAKSNQPVAVSNPKPPAAVQPGPVKNVAPAMPVSKGATHSAMPAKNPAPINKTVPALPQKGAIQKPGKIVQPVKSTSVQTNNTSSVTSSTTKTTVVNQRIVEADDDYSRSPMVVFSSYITKKEYFSLMSISYDKSLCKSKSDYQLPYCEDKSFNPDDPLTREELIAYAEYSIRGKPDYKLSQTTPRFCRLYIAAFIDDADRVNLPYAKMIYRNLSKSDLINKLFHIFDNNILVFLPQRPVTKDQAMKCIKFLWEEKASHKSV